MAGSDGDLDGRVTMFNPGAERMLGWPAGEVLGRDLVTLVHDPDEIAARAAELGLVAGQEVSGPGLKVRLGGVGTRDLALDGPRRGGLHGAGAVSTAAGDCEERDSRQHNADG